MPEGERRPIRHPPPRRPGKFVYTASIRIETAEPSPAAAILGSGFAHFRLREVPIYTAMFLNRPLQFRGNKYLPTAGRALGGAKARKSKRGPRSPAESPEVSSHSPDSAGGRGSDMELRR